MSRNVPALLIMPALAITPSTRPISSTASAIASTTRASSLTSTCCAEHAAPVLLQRGRRLGVLLGPPTPDHDVAARPGDAPGEAQSDAGVAAGDDDHPAGEIEHLLLL